MNTSFKPSEFDKQAAAPLDMLDEQAAAERVQQILHPEMRETINAAKEAVAYANSPTGKRIAAESKQAGLNVWHAYVTNSDNTSFEVKKSLILSWLDQIALAESQAAELREEVRQLKINRPLTVEGIEGLIDEIRTRNTRIAELEAALERRHRAMTDEEWDNRPSVEAGPSYWPRLITAILATRSREQEPAPTTEVTKEQ